MATSTTDKILKDYIQENAEILTVLRKAGINNIETALNYLLISQLDDNLQIMYPQKGPRKNRISDQMVVSKRTVDSALSIMSKKVKIKNAP